MAHPRQLRPSLARTPGALAAVACGAALAYSPTIALIVTGCLLLSIAALIAVTGIETGKLYQPLGFTITGKPDSRRPKISRTSQ